MPRAKNIYGYRRRICEFTGVSDKILLKLCDIISILPDEESAPIKAEIRRRDEEKYANIIMQTVGREIVKALSNG